jgi:hypothetical protein
MHGTRRPHHTGCRFVAPADTSSRLLLPRPARVKQKCARQASTPLTWLVVRESRSRRSRSASGPGRARLGDCQVEGRRRRSAPGCCFQRWCLQPNGLQLAIGAVPAISYERLSRRSRAPSPAFTWRGYAGVVRRDRRVRIAPVDAKDVRTRHMRRRLPVGVEDWLRLPVADCVRWWIPTENAQPDPGGRGDHGRRSLSWFEQRDRSAQQQRLVGGTLLIAIVAKHKHGPGGSAARPRPLVPHKLVAVGAAGSDADQSGSEPVRAVDPNTTAAAHAIMRCR